jgi:hypothetical protein
MLTLRIGLPATFALMGSIGLALGLLELTSRWGLRLNPGGSDQLDAA